VARGRTLGQFNFLHPIHDEHSDVLARTAIADQVQRAVMKVNSIRIDLALGGRLSISESSFIARSTGLAHDM
jgi:hypothetical protein